MTKLVVSNKLCSVRTSRKQSRKGVSKEETLQRFWRSRDNVHMAHRGSPRQRYLSNIQLSLDHCEWPTVWSKASLVIIKEEEMWDKSLVLSAFEALKSSKLISSSSSIYLRHAKERSILRVRNRNGLFFEMGIKSSTSKQA